MEIDRFNFWEKLPNILKTISEAQYVAIDLEMSGIQVDQFRGMPVPAKPTLQDAYDDAMMAAEMYTILQFGFTCISWERERKSYVTKTFNIPLYPGVNADDFSSRDLASTMNRCIRFSTKTLAFLENNGFNFLDVFHKGVPYLSAKERDEKEIVDFITLTRPAEELIDANELPVKSIEFRNDVEAKLINWRLDQLTVRPQPEPLRIYSPLGHRLNGLQKRLVHQLVQDQFPQFRAVSRQGGTYMEIIDFTSQTPDSEMVLQRLQAISKQTGARILWDAICGQPFARTIDTRVIAGDDPVKFMQLRTEINGYESRLRNKSPVVIGHNILMDLCFLHCKFVGHMPNSLQEFRSVTRERLPRIVDTKYLFTRGGNEMSPDHNLSECFTAMESQQLPVVASDPSYGYSKPCLHQAGYDSYMTAVVFLKKSYRLNQERVGLWYIAAEDLGEREAIRSASLSVPKAVPRQMTLALLKARDDAPPNPALPPMPDVAEVPRLPLEYWADMVKPRPADQGNLLEDCDENVVAALAKFRVMQPERHFAFAAPMTAPPTPDRSPDCKPSPKPKPMSTLRRKGERDSPAKAVVVPGMLPEWEGRFWSKYGNRSRVGQFGHILYFGKMAGERMPGDQKTEKLGTEMLEELGGKTDEEVEWSVSS